MKQATKLYDLRPLYPEDFPGHALAVPTTGDRLGFARPLWRVLSWHCGDLFADWVVDRCAQYVDPWAQLKAACAIAEVRSFGAPCRASIAELFVPHVPPDESLMVMGALYSEVER